MDRGEPSLKPEWLVRGVATPTAAAACLRPGISPRAGELPFLVNLPFCCILWLVVTAVYRMYARSVVIIGVAVETFLVTLDNFTPAVIVIIGVAAETFLVALDNSTPAVISA